MDHQLQEYSYSRGYTFTRYADDLIFSTNKDLIDDIITSYEPIVLSNEIINIIEKQNGFLINYKKVKLYTNDSGMYVTGIKVNSKINVSRKYYRQIRTIIYIIKKYGLNEAYKFYMTKCSVRQRFKKQIDIVEILSGKISFLKQVKGDNDKLVLKLKNELDKIKKFASATYITDNLISYVRECGYSAELTEGFCYTFLNIRKNGEKIGVIRSHWNPYKSYNHSNFELHPEKRRMFTNIKQFAGPHIVYMDPIPSFFCDNYDEISKWIKDKNLIPFEYFKNKNNLDMNE